MFELIIHGVQGQMTGQNTDDSSSTFIPCYNKQNWHNDAWCQTDCIKQVLNNPEICDWHCVDPELARTTQTNTGGLVIAVGKGFRNVQILAVAAVPREMQLGVVAQKIRKSVGTTSVMLPVP